MGRGQGGSGGRRRLAGGGAAATSQAERKAAGAQLTDSSIAQDSLIDGLVGKPLTYPEIKAISDYTTTDYRKVNATLGGFERNGKIPKMSEWTEDQRKMHANLPTALSKMPAYEGATYRTIHFEDMGAMEKFVKGHKIGEGVRYGGYISTSADPTKGKFGSPSFNEVLATGGQQGIVMYTINGKRGRDIRKYSSLGGAEGEVLFTHGSRFKVTNVRRLTNGGYHITLEQ